MQEKQFQKQIPINYWNSLSMREKAEMMRVAIDNGITNLADIRQAYNEYAEGGDINPDNWTMEDENQYQIWRASLPDNLRNTDDRYYDMRAAFKAGMTPTLEADGKYHLGSRDPKTGKILKAPYHPTYLEAVNTDARLGYYPTVDSKGNTYTNTWEGNRYDGGGYKPSERIKKRISNWEGAAMYKDTIDPLSGKMAKKNAPFETVTSGFVSVLPASIREQVLSNQELADNLFSYAYNVGPGRFKERVVPSLVKYYAGQATVDDITNSMWASGDKKLKGLRNRRAEERQGVRNALNGNIPSMPEPYVQGFNPMPAFTPSNPEAFFETQTASTPVLPFEPEENPLVEAAMKAYTEEALKEEERAQGLRNFSTILSLTSPTGESNYLLDTVNLLSGNISKDGGSIHIKPSHRGRLTELKERTGKSEAELYNDGNPAHKKMVVFARSARKWKHGLGGNLFDDGGDKDNIFKYTNSNGDVRYVYQDNPDAKEVSVRPLNTIFPDPAQWTFTDDAGKFYTPRRTTPTNTAELNPDNRTGFERALDNYIGEAFNTVPKGYHTLPAIGAAAFGLANPALGEAALKSGFGAHGLSKWMNGEINGPLDAAITALEILPLGQLTKPMLNTGIEVLEKYPALYQYPRYAVGKFKYGFDAQLPTLYRKVKNFPKIEDGRMMVSNPRSRFAFDNGYGEESPVITNFTTDVPVRSHSSGNWDRGLTLAFPGKTLLGKNVISTRPSDTFTFGNNISVPVRDVTAFTGRPKEISFLQNSGVKTISSPDAEIFWESGVADLVDKIAKARATNAKIFNKRGSGIPLLKPKTPVDNFDNYATTIENLARETFRSPTTRDYEFMDYVFKPLYRTETIPKIDDFTIQALDNYPALGEWIGNSERRRYLEDPWRWENLMYDPLTPIESEFRKKLNIGLKPEFKK